MAPPAHRRLHAPRISAAHRRACSLIVLASTALLLVACGAGQITQTDTQQAAINGTNAALGDLLLRNVYFEAEPTDPAVPRYGQVTRPSPSSTSPPRPTGSSRSIPPPES
ncbi:hypothetical protein [Rhodococcus rhodochrous]|uniref:hypothetical protein n=1 Tax=Rhodococcus rhodochrous TaxID=1829 RepID=UPI0002EE4B37|nr:hypothetical protein [Rhodococcus rhodochrous]